MVSHWFSSHYKIICLPYYNFNLSCTHGYGIMFSQYSKPNTGQDQKKTGHRTSEKNVSQSDLHIIQIFSQNCFPNRYYSGKTAKITYW